jgi:hypothetical protein
MLPIKHIMHMNQGYASADSTICPFTCAPVLVVLCFLSDRRVAAMKAIESKLLHGSFPLEIDYEAHVITQIELFLDEIRTQILSVVFGRRRGDFRTMFLVISLGH